MANFPIPTSGTAWASGGISGRVGSSKMQRRRNRFQGTKVPRMQKWWAPQNTDSDGGDPYYIGVGTAANVLLVKHGFYDTSGDGGAPIAQGLSGKLWRFDGFIKLYLNPLDTDYSPAVPDMARVMYCWLKLKVDADSYDGSTLGGAGNFSPVTDWSHLMRRDDILRWGSVNVYGPTPDTPGNIPIPIQLPTGGAAHANYDAAFIMNRRMSFHGQPEAHIPFPRVPRAGLNLKSGEELALFAQTYHLTDVLSTSGSRGVYAFPRFRMLLSK